MRPSMVDPGALLFGYPARISTGATAAKRLPIGGTTRGTTARLRPAGMPAARFASGHSIRRRPRQLGRLRQLLVQRRTRDAEPARGLHAIAAGSAQRIADRRALERGD